MLARNAVSAGTAAALANDRKMRLMGEQCAREGMVLVLFSVETRAWGSSLRPPSTW